MGKVLIVNTIRVSLGKRFLLGNRGAPAGVVGSGVDGPLRNQLLIAQMIKILSNKKHKSKLILDFSSMMFRCSNPKTHDATQLHYTVTYYLRKYSIKQSISAHLKYV